MRMIVYTATFGETEPVRVPIVRDPSVQYLCFSDGPIAPAPYQTIFVDTTERPHIASRRIKVLADHPALAETDLLLWHDASYRLLRDCRWARRRLIDADLVAMRHARRSRIEDEALAIARYGYVTSDQAVALVESYRAEGFDGEDLTSSGLLARRRSPIVEAFAAAWWAEVQRWGGRDQGSFDYAAWRIGASIGYVKGNHRGNPYAAWRQPVGAAAVVA